MSELRIGDGKDWSFLEGNWQDGPDGELTPPDGPRIEYMAVRHAESYGDFTATFRFKMQRPGGAARLLFRVQDSRRFYALEIPYNGQQQRSRHFWAGLVIADGTGLQRYLSFKMVPGLCANLQRWFDARLEVKGNRFRAWVNDIPVVDVEDDTYASGPVGLAALANPFLDTPRFASVDVTGTATPTIDWPGLAAPAQHWITPNRRTDPNCYQSYAQIMQAPSGEVTLHLTWGNPNAGETLRIDHIRSTDGGRTWADPEPCTLQRGFGAWFCREDGTIVSIHGNNPILSATPFFAYESSDEGRSWSLPMQVQLNDPWPEAWKLGGPVKVIRMADGALVMPVICSLADEAKSPSLVPFHAALVMRSDDDGRTWSGPVHCDSSHHVAGEPLRPEMGGGLVHAGRYFELGMDEVRPNVIVGIGRPERDPYMWQMRSEDGGRSWEPAAWGHFPGYCPSLTATQSGAVVATTRYPHFAAYLSRDGCRTWDPPVIVDYCGWANQQAVEVEPDVVLVTYMGEITTRGQADSRIARLQVTGDGLRLDH